MNLKKGLILSLMLLTGCSSNEKKLSSNEPDPNQLKRLAQMQSVDHERAARLNIDLGLRYFKQGQIARAKSKFNRAMRLAPHLAEVHFSYAYFLEQVGEIDGAREAYVESIRLAPGSGVARNNYGTFLCRQGQYQEALVSFDKAVNDKNYANSSEAMENAGLCALKFNDHTKAVAYFERALRHDPRRADALIELAHIRLAERNITQARQYYHQYEQISQPTPRSLTLGIELAKLSGDRNKQSSLELLLKAQYPEYRRQRNRS